jgi:hypothetical protein
MPDVMVGDGSTLWNARDGVGRLGPGIPKSDFWASAKEGIDQVGCVYTGRTERASLAEVRAAERRRAYEP